MTTTRQLLSVGVLAGLTVLTVTSHAKAAPVGNPGYFEFIIMPEESIFKFGGEHILLHNFTASHYFAAEVDGDGYAHDFESNFPAATFVVGTKTITARLELRSTSEGIIDVPSQTFDFNNLVARVRFTVDSVACNTSNFTMAIWTGHWGLAPEVCSTGYDKTTGEFCVSGSGFTVPQLPATACGNNGNLLNSTFDLGISTWTEMKILGGVTSPIMVD